MKEIQKNVIFRQGGSAKPKPLAVNREIFTQNYEITLAIGLAISHSNWNC